MVDYRAKLVLAPMVRIGELPTRLLALKYGADLVWGPEIIDKRLVRAERVYNPILNTVDFIQKDGNKKVPGTTDLVFRTYRKLEQGKLIFQLGTASPELAVQAAKIVAADVDGIDINAGCPKHFSVHSGMGAALLKTPDVLCSILSSLVEQVGKPFEKPISVKIRLLPEQEQTLDLVRKLVKTGIANLTVHCRTREMRNGQPPIRDYIHKIKEICVEADVSLIINGGIKSYQEFKEMQEKYGSDISCMIASKAETNPTVFNPEGPLPWPKLAKEYVRFAKQFNNSRTNSKYCLAVMMPNTRGKNVICRLVSQAKENDEIYDAVLNKMDDEGKYIGDEIQYNDAEVEDRQELKRKLDLEEAESLKRIRV
ncbi:hypothetical protein KL905_003312 [Ogataea polymorpha]|uniref:DUS-like FMN-binding domain-containing protein n=2 Tax=Ogataea polymorpha TaxID=460523 RepID=A0A9P8PT14_9ASCO|nr:hypothetical protein KL937_003051 [Ogataea polymorpha]KAG7888470.1 hypothetical protein KL936_003682 [Ogataea polymorpha]KAG7892354.1 hypothetical protein KL908_003306 [Ogataea polymorpha]KAG7900201.1 hypothetical protein KL935_002944 [Ogataea polymorpha]KAG7902997.1 hypothetical protein KL907_004130 [Ogataea polymorpha]